MTESMAKPRSRPSHSMSDEKWHITPFEWEPASGVRFAERSNILAVGYNIIVAIVRHCCCHLPGFKFIYSKLTI